jgi:SAM-dependent methyltransferase
MTDNFFPANLEQATVLEVGCGDGFFCIEAKKRNAGRVVGVDPDGERLAAAARSAAEKNLDIQFLQGGIQDCAALGRFDYVLCLGLPQSILDPIDAIHKLVDLTRRKLVLELEDVDLEIVKFSRKTGRRALLGAWRMIFKLLPARLRPGILAVDSHGKFLMTGNWVKNLLRAQRQDVDRVEIVDSDRPQRYLALAHMRRLRALLLVSGPAGIGKSHFTRRLLPEDAALKHLLGFDEKDASQTMGDVALDEGVEVKASRLVLEYNIWRPVERYWGDYGADPVLTIIRAAEARRVCLLVAPKEVVMERVRGRDRARSSPSAKVEWLEREYSLPGRYRKIYERWIAYCKANGCDITYLNVSSPRIEVVSEDAALKLIGGDS